MLQTISLLFPVANNEKWVLTQDDIMLPQIDGFNCCIHSILNTHYLLFLKTDEDDTVSDYCYEILTAPRYWFVYKLKT